MPGAWIPPKRQQIEREQAKPPALVAPAQNKMSVDERTSLEREIREKKFLIDNKDEGEFTSTNIDRDPMALDRMRSDVRKKEIALQRDEDLVAKGRDKDKIYAKIREIESRIRPHMPSENEMWAKLGTSESDLAVRKNIEFQKRFGRDLVELKNLKRRLEAQDPNAGDLEKLRPR